MNLLEYPIITGAVGGVILGSPFIVAAIIAWRGRRKKYLQFSSEDGFRLRYSSEIRFQQCWKFFPWEGVALLKVDQQDLVFEAHPNNGDQFTLRVPVEDLQLHGRRSWLKNGLLPWLLLRNESSDFYLCVETGPLIFGAGKKTRELLASVKQQAEQGGLGNPHP